MITLEQYYMGRDTTYANELTSEIRSNAEETVRRANLLLERFLACNPRAVKNRGVNSGWRPAAVNARIPTAAKRSKHMMGQAIDIWDGDEQLDTWLMAPEGQFALADIGLWMEHPSATKGWCHLQIKAPASGRRVFYP